MDDSMIIGTIGASVSVAAPASRFGLVATAALLRVTALSPRIGGYSQHGDSRPLASWGVQLGSLPCVFTAC